MHFSQNGQDSWVGAVIVTLIIFTSHLPHSASHLASLLNADGGLPVVGPSGKQQSSLPPFALSQLTREFPRNIRDPRIRSDDEEGRLSFLSSPMHQTRYRPHRFSQTQGHVQSVVPHPQHPPLDHDNEDNNHGKNHPSSLSSHQSPSSGDREDTDVDQDEDPAFTPFISARALSNMGKFFEHLQENLLAMQQEGRGGNGNLEIGQPERRRMTSESSDILQQESVDSSSSQDYDASPEAKAVYSALRWQPQASGIFRTAETISSPPPVTPSSPKIGGGGASRIRFQKMQTFFQPTNEDRRANKYDPAWLWTTMGLGKK